MGGIHEYLTQSLNSDIFEKKVQLTIICVNKKALHSFFWTVRHIQNEQGRYIQNERKNSRKFINRTCKRRCQKGEFALVLATVDQKEWNHPVFLLLRFFALNKQLHLMNYLKNLKERSTCS